MTHSERADRLLGVARQLTEAQRTLDALVVGDPTGITNELKHSLDEPIERVRAYARQLYMGDLPSRLDTPGSEGGVPR